LWVWLYLQSKQQRSRQIKLFLVSGLCSWYRTCYKGKTEPNIDNSVHAILNLDPSNFSARLQSFVTLILVSSVCPSVRMEQFDANVKKIRENLYWTDLLKYVGNIQVSLKSDRNIRIFTWIPKYVCDNISLNSSWMEKSSG
jgi:hypothetical protein